MCTGYSFLYQPPGSNKLLRGKKMIKDEVRFSVMCEISMALKSPKLQQGFEIICKNLSNLEKENAELQDKLKNLSSVAEVRLANWQKYEKENTELKEEIADINKNFTLCESNADTYYDLLIKAKEIIKELNEGLDKLYLSGLSDKQIAFIEQLQDKAEQFIEEVSE